MSRLGPRRSFNLHISRRYNDIVDRRYRRHRVQGQGDMPRQGRLVRIYILLRRFQSCTNHMGRGFSPSMHMKTSRHELSSVLRRAHARAFTASVNSKTAVSPSTSPTSPCEPALRISTLHPYACPTVKCHESCTCNRNLYPTPAFGRYNVTLL